MKTIEKLSHEEGYEEGLQDGLAKSKVAWEALREISSRRSPRDAGIEVCADIADEALKAIR